MNTIALRAMHGKVVLVTGGTSGIGRETAFGLARQGAHVTIVARDARRAAETVEWIRRESGNTQVDSLLADLSSPPAVRELARAFRQRFERLDVLVNNAGSIFSTRETTPEGFERTWALDHLAYVTLTLDLLPLLSVASPSRIVNVSSTMHKQGVIDFDNLQGEKRFSAMRAYSQAKLANVLFTYSLARKLAGTGVTANCLHPGFVASGFGRDMRGFIGFVQRVLVQPFGMPAAQGAATSIHLASSPDVKDVSGKYFVKSQEARSSDASYDVALQDRVWKLSLEQVQMADMVASRLL